MIPPSFLPLWADPLRAVAPATPAQDANGPDGALQPLKPGPVLQFLRPRRAHSRFPHWLPDLDRSAPAGGEHHPSGSRRLGLDPLAQPNIHFRLDPARQPAAPGRWALENGLGTSPDRSCCAPGPCGPAPQTTAGSGLVHPNPAHMLPSLLCFTFPRGIIQYRLPAI